MKRKSIIITFLILIFTMVMNLGYSAWLIIKDKQVDPGYDQVGIYNYIEDNQSVIYNGDGQAPHIDEELTSLDGATDDFSYQYKIKGSDDSFVDGKPTNVGTYTMTISSLTFGVAENITFTITKATPTINSVTPIYNQVSAKDATKYYDGYFTTAMVTSNIEFNHDISGVKGEKLDGLVTYIDTRTTLEIGTVNYSYKFVPSSANYNEVIVNYDDEKAVSIITYATVNFINGNETILTIEVAKDSLLSDGFFNHKQNGYELDGWYFNDTKWNFDTDKVVTDMTLIAHWIPIEYTITYNLVGGQLPDGITNKETYTIEETFTINNPIKSGYTFAGWDVEYVGEKDHYHTELDFTYSEQTPNLIINAGTFGDLSLTAIWLAREYDITYVNLENAVFDLNGHPSSLNPNPLKIKADETITLINPTGKRGYNFAGWTLKNEDTPTLQMVLSEVRENLTITAHWTPIEYTIKYNLDGGSLPEGITNPTTYTVESETFTLNNPVKEGYEFTGWSGWTLDGEANTQVSIPQGTIGDIEFTAHYSIVTYNITYELNGGFFDIEYPRTYNYEQSVTLVPPTKNGYKFIGWTGENGITPEINVSIPVHSTGDKHFIANWEKVVYNITYYDTLEGNALGCVDETYPSTYTIEDELVTIPNATKDGYTFNSWSAYSDIKDENDLPKFTFNGKDISFAKGSTYGNLVFVAAFDAKPFTITYNLNDNTNVKASFTGSDVIEYYITSTLTIPNPIRPGYGFNGWEVINEDPKGPTSFTTNERGELIISNSFGNLTLNAKWIITPYEITFYDGDTKLDATEAYNVEMTSVSETELYKVQYIPTKTGYIFMGWECDDITVILDQETGLTNILPFMTYGNLKLTAIYNVHETTINYELNGGNYYDNEWNLVDNTNPIKLTYEQSHTLVNPARPGYDFEGWTLNGNIITVLEKLTEDEITLVANWSDPIPYTISYFDGAVDVALGCVDETYPVSYNITDTLTIPNASKEGYTFNGWSVTSDEGRNAYKVTSTTSVTINPGEAFGNLTFIANFTINNYKLTFVENGGTPEMEDKELAYNTELVLPTENDITRNGYTFEGWYVDNSFNEAAPTHMPAKDLTLYAKWEEITYNISYYDTIVSEETKITNLEPKQYTIETEQVIIPNPSKDGYKFVSWHITNETTGDTLTHIVDENGSMYSFVANSTYGHLTFVATFEPIGYSITYKLNTGTSNAQATFEVQTSQYLVTSPDIKIAKPTRNGYNFVSWDVEGFANVNGSVISVDDEGNTIIPTGTYGNLVFTATWSEPINYTLSLFNATYDAENDTYTKDSETPVHTITYTIEDTSIRLEELFEVEFIPTKEGYIFNGWYNENLAITVNEEGLYTVLPFLTYGDYDLYARYSVHSTNITYELNGGKYYDNLWNEVEDNNPTSLTYEQTHTLINPAKPGYTFTGWKLNDEIVTVLEKLTADSITLVATYSDAIEYTISYYDGTYDEENPEENKITNIDVTSYTIETSEFVIPNATKEGYEFEKYTIISSEGENAINFTDEDLTDGITIKANEVWGNLVLVASFKVNQYTITFNSNGGSEVAPIKADFNTIITAPASPTRNGYTFAGWYEDENLTGEAYVFTTMPAKNFTLHANWTENEYTIKAYDKADYDEESQTYRLIEQYTYKITDTQNETPLTIPNPSKDGYTFAGWVDATNDENENMVLGASLPLVIPTDMYGNIEIYATWNNIMYSIEYDYQDSESVSKAIHSKITEYQISTVDIKIVNPIRHGYEFLGWDAEYVGEKEHSDTNLDFTYSKENPETTLVIPTGTYGDIKLTALWKVIDYTVSIIGVNADDVTFDGTGLNGSFNDATGNYEFKYTVESQDITILAPQRIGYTFASWTISETYANINEELIAPIGETKSYQIPHGTYGDVSLTATWGVNTYTITFDSNEGTDVASITQEFNTPVVEPTAPTKPGYTFAGWYEDENLTGEKYVFTTMPAKDFTLYADWSMDTYTISYYDTVYDEEKPEENRINLQPSSYNYEQELVSIPNATKDGYTFNSWRIINLRDNSETIFVTNEGSTYSFNKNTVYGDLVFVASFNTDTYTIKYEYNIPDTSASKEVTHNTNLVEYSVVSDNLTVVNPTRKGYDFLGWTIENSVEDIADIEFVVSAQTPNYVIPTGTFGNLIFTANWSEPINYTITYNDDGGYYLDQEGNALPNNPNTVNFTVESDTITVINPVKTGYTFTGWTGTGLEEATTTLTIERGSTEDRTYTATWGVNTYTITFDSKGGTDVASITQEFNTPVVEPTAPTKPGYTFAGWYKDENLTGEKYVFTTMPAESFTLYAKWDLYQYTVSIVGVNANDITFNDTGLGGSFNDATGNYEFKYNVESENITILAPEKVGYTFSSWTISENHANINGNPIVQVDNNKTYVIPTGTYGDITFTAVFGVNTYNLTFVYDNGQENKVIPYEFGAQVQAEPDPSKTGYTFDGWDKEIPATMPAEDMTITATWTINQYTITFNTDGGTLIDPITQDYGTAITKPANPTKLGYVFGGWDKEIPATMPAEDMTITAQWNIDSYDLTYVLNGGTLSNNYTNPKKVEFNSVLPLPTNSDITKVGYSFAGWYYDAEFENEVKVEDTMPAESISIYAKWTADVYTITYNLENGTNHPENPDSYTIETETFTIKNPTRTGYIFKGWSGTGLTGSENKEFAIEKGSTGHRTFNANWTIDSYKITFDLNIAEGSASPLPEKAQLEFTVESTALVIDPLERKGYTFLGWTVTGYENVDSNISYIENDDKSITIPTGTCANLTFKANWSQPISYNISYELNGGSVETENTTSFTVETPTFTVNNPTKSGYTFAGWEGTNIQQAVMTLTIERGSTENRTYTATWTKDSYGISYDLNDDNLLDSSKDTKAPAVHNNPKTSYDVTETFTLVNPTRNGYTFLGWTGSNGNVAQLVVTINEGTTGVLSYVANWKLESYTISYELKDGTVATANPESFTVENDNFTLNNPTKEGHTFLGWTGSNGDVAQLDVTINTSDTTNREYVANYSVDSHTITFMNENVVHHTITAPYGTPIVAPADPTKTGYTFAGWDKQIPTTMPAEDVTITATWTINQYTITFNANGGLFKDGTNEIVIKQDYNTDVTAPIAPTRNGYTFVGWDKAVPDKMPAENMTITAQWGINSYKLTIVYDNGTPNKEVTYKYNDEIPAEADPSKLGYTFTGWDKEFPTTMPAKDVTITAQWTINQYTITFNTDGGTLIDPITQNYDTDIQVPANPTKTGYTFSHWINVETKEITTVPTKMPAFDLSLKAIYSVNQYTITFNSNGGSEVASISANFNEEITAPANPTKTGHTFAGWYRDSEFNGDKYIIPERMPAESFTLYAKWTVNQYTITFDTKGGTLIDPITQDYGTAITKPANPTKEGFTFGGWDREIPASMPAEDMTITAQWTINQYTITFNSNGGSEVASISADFNEEITAPADPAKTGHTFAGWYKDLEFNGDKYIIPERMPAESFTLYAKWDVNQYTITFDTKGGTKIDPITGDYGMEIVVPADPTKTGYTFTGWDKEIPASMPAEDMTITAQWTINQYTITWVVDGKTTKESYEYGATPSFKGSTDKAADAQYTYTFTGWDKELVEVVADATYTAQYSSTVNTYTIKFVNDNGDELDVQTLEYGAMPVYGGTTPTKAATAKYTYTYSGWDKQIVAVVGDATYTATYSSTINKYTIIWVNWNDEELYRADVEYDAIPEYKGNTPTKEKDAQFTYSWTGWTPNVVAVTGTATYKAVFSNETNSYTVTFDANGGTFEDGKTTISNNYLYNSVVEVPNDPSKTGHTFGGWDPSVSVVTCTITYKAIWTTNTYTITWKDGNGGVLKTEQVAYGDTPEYTGETPTKTATAQYTYTFNGTWSPEIVAVTEEATYTAQFNATVNKYTITWKDGNDVVLKTEQVAYGDTPEYTGETPTKTATAQYTYTFNDTWSPEIVAVTEEATYTAQFNATVNTYTVVWKNYNGAVLETDENVPYGTMPSYDGDDPVKSGSAEFSYEWIGWTPNVKEVTGDAEYTATFNEATNKYTVTFIYGDGVTANKIVSVFYGDTVSPGDDPLRTGYTFNYWYNTNENEAFDFGTEITSDITLNAKWTAKTYHIKYYQEIGDNTSLLEGSDTYTIESGFTVNRDPVKTGYVFSKWTGTNSETSEEYSGKTITISVGTIGDIHLYANWTIDSYELIFDVNDGDSIDSITYDYGDTVQFNTLPTPTRNGYDFAGWYHDGNLTDKITASFTMPASDKTIYAAWVAHEYTISFEENGGTTVSDIKVAYKSTITGLPTANDISKQGYTFGGWFYNEGLTVNVPATMPASDITLYAKWNVETYSITFMVDGQQYHKIEEPYGTSISAPSAPTKEGNTFVGWYKNNSAYTVPTTMPAENITVTAKWNVNSYTITFNTNGGTPSSIAPITGDYGTNITAPDDPTKSGYVFNGWYYTDNNSNEIEFDFDQHSTMPASNYNLVAKWAEDTFTISFDTKDGTPTNIDSITKTYGSTITAPTVQLIKTGYTFAGWYEKEDCSGNEYVFNKMPAKNFTLYAKWTPITYTISYNMVNGTNHSSNPTSYTIEDTITLQQPTKAGYVFTGWESISTSGAFNGSTGTDLNFVIPKGSYGNISIQAGWDLADPYTITYDLAGGVLESGKTNPTEYYLANNEGITLNNPIRTGYNFAGWTGTDLAQATMTVTIPKGSEGNRAYTATWTPIPYTVKLENVSGNDITFDTTGLNGSFVDGVYTFTYTIESDDITIGSPSKAGYQFNGWSGTTINGNPVPTITIAKGSIGDRVYSANFSNSVIKVVLTTPTEEITYDGAKHNVNVSLSVGETPLTELPDGVTITYTFTDSKDNKTISTDGIVNAEEYTVTYELTDSNNQYSLDTGSTESATLVIKKATPTINFTAPQNPQYEHNIVSSSTYSITFTKADGSTETLTGGTFNLVFPESYTSENGEAELTAKYTQNKNSNYNPNFVDEVTKQVNVKVETVAHIDSTSYFATIEKALSKASSGNTVYAIPGKNQTITENCEVKSGVKFMIPYEGTTASSKVSSSTEGNFTGTLCNTVTLASNVQLTINGTLEIGGILSGGSGGANASGQTVSKYSEMLLCSGAKLIVNGAVDCYGYINEQSSYNSSSIVVNNAGKVSLPFIIRDHAGGSVMYGLYDSFDTYHSSAFNQYEVRNITPQMTIKYGGSLMGYANIYAGDQTNSTDINLIGSSSSYVFQLTDSTYSYAVSKSDGYGNTDLDLYGGTNMNSLTLKVTALVEVNLSTDDVYFPLTYKFDISLNKNPNQTTTAQYSMNQRYKMMPGHDFVVGEGTHLTAEEIIVYSRFDDSSSALPWQKYNYSGGATLTVNGSLTATNLAGTVLTNTETGAVLNVTGNTEIVSYEPRTYEGSSITTEIKTWFLVSEKLNLHLFKGTYTDTRTTNVSSGTYYSKAKGWHATELTIYYDANGGTLTGSTSEYHSGITSAGYRVSSLGASTPTRDYYSFGGWYYDENGTAGNEVIGSTIYSSMTAYAKWIPIEYGINYVDKYYDNFTTGSSTQNSENLEVFTIETPQSKLLKDPTNGNYEFDGWYLDSNCTVRVNNFYGANLVNYLDSNNKVTLYALWYPAGTEKYTVIYVNDNEDVTCQSSESFVITSTEAWNTINLPDMDNDNTTLSYDQYFLGWYIGETKVTKLNASLFTNNTCTLTAKWTNKYKVTFNAGSEALSYSVYTYNGQSITLPTISQLIEPSIENDVISKRTMSWKVGSNEYACGTSQTPTADTTYVANIAVTNYYPFTFGFTSSSATLSISNGNLIEGVDDETYETSKSLSADTKIYISENAIVKFTLSYGKSRYNGFQIMRNDVEIDYGESYRDKPTAKDLTVTPGTYSVKVSSGDGDAVCILGESLVLMADGTYKQAKDVKLGDMLMTWSFEEGKYVARPVFFLERLENMSVTKTTLYFDDGTSVDMVYGQAYFDVNAKRFVSINADNVHQYVGVELFVYDNGNVSSRKIVGYHVEHIIADTYEFITAYDYSFIYDNLLSMEPFLLYHLPFEVNDDFKYDEEKMKQDIEKYGLYKPEEWAEYVTEEQFYLFNGQYIKVAVEKGYYTKEYLIEIIKRYVNSKNMS